MRRIEMPWGALNCFKNTEAGGQFIPKTGFLTTAELKRIRGVIELAALDPKCRVKFAYQVADTVNSGFAVYKLDAERSAEGLFFGTMADITAEIDDKQLVRFGLFVWTSDSTNDVLHCCQCGGYVELAAC